MSNWVLAVLLSSLLAQSDAETRVTRYLRSNSFQISSVSVFLAKSMYF